VVIPEEPALSVVEWGPAVAFVLAVAFLVVIPEGGSAVAFVLAVAFLVVIPEGDLLLPLALVF
jgi:hypothetical protein